MAREVVLSDQAEAAIRKLPRNLQRQIIAKTEALATEPRPPGVKKLVGHQDLWRVRSGDYRIVYSIHDAVVLIVRVAPRGEAYRRLASKR